MSTTLGDGKECDEHQTRVLLEAAGFGPGRLLPTTHDHTRGDTSAPAGNCMTHALAATVHDSISTDVSLRLSDYCESFSPGRLLPTTGLMTIQEVTPRHPQATA